MLALVGGYLMKANQPHPSKGVLGDLVSAEGICSMELFVLGACFLFFCCALRTSVY